MKLTRKSFLIITLLTTLPVFCYLAIATLNTIQIAQSNCEGAAIVVSKLEQTTQAVLIVERKSDSERILFTEEISPGEEKRICFQSNLNTEVELSYPASPADLSSVTIKVGDKVNGKYVLE